eukprot:CAMPEP_0169082504 /NCGR_PEP_ID=MMETSP1015-20121227/11583_1 /TAXON_ID=342587 /ORGANISM="Karlodinium micrum, Strain CCMP2283" /LENGTH=120 /DNA_ID=CAMNT_0009142371 /DNA_START=93 /DNA_END=455 /DNA_ORIENTATION=+
MFEFEEPVDSVESFQKRPRFDRMHADGMCNDATSSRQFDHECASPHTSVKIGDHCLDLLECQIEKRYSNELPPGNSIKRSRMDGATIDGDFNPYLSINSLLHRLHAERQIQRNTDMVAKS